MVSPTVAAEIGSRLGRVEEVEKRQRQDAQNLFMRVKVAIPDAKPIRRGGFVARTDGQRPWETFKYERLPMLCHWCGLLGHDLKHCAQYFGATKNGEKVICQYGDWMKSLGGRSRSPSKKESTHTGSHRDNEDTDRRRTSSNGRRVAAEEEESRPKNPRLNGSDEKGKNVVSGVTADFAGRDNEEASITNLKHLSSNVKNTIHAKSQTEGAGLSDVKDFNGP